MTYIEKNMLPGEQLHNVIHPTLRPFYVGYVSFGILTLGVGFIILLPNYLINITVNHFKEIALTSNRISKKTGIVARRVDEFLIRQIESVEIKQGVFGRLLNYGEVRIHGTGGDPMSCIVNDPRSFKMQIDQVVMEIGAGWRR